jgi:2-polyprenyl-3-methyl-5-hydroxy-6-metoxy-1,4-benzoquinol methylase
MTNPIAESYNADPAREWDRLAKSAYRSLEFTITWHHLCQHLSPSGHILDAGGGPGRYSLALCQAGYAVTLLDLSEGNIALARQNFAAEPPEVQAHLRDATVGDVTDLSRFADGTFDAVICLGGVLSHIQPAAARQQAAHELVRVVKPGGVVAITGVGYFAVLRTILMEFSHEMLWPTWPDFLQTHDSEGPTHTHWHWFTAADLRRLAESCGLQTITMAGCQGLSVSLIEATNRLAEEPEKWQRWLDLLLQTSTDPAVVEMAEHLLYIGRKL